MLSISTTLFGVISHGRLFFTGHCGTPIAEQALGSAESRLKIIVIQ